MMFLLGMIIFVGMIVMAMMMSGEMMMFVNLPSLIVVIPPALMFTLTSSSKQSRSHAVKLLFNESLHLNSAELIAAKHVFTTFGNLNILMGFIGVIIGAMAMGSSLNGENISQIFGSAFAVCVLPFFYAFLIKVLCYAAEAKIQFKIINLAS
jgi:flagellar motor component MotA